MVVPNSAPSSRTRSWPGPSISVGKGPSPTRVTYAFATPMIASIRFGPIPTPTAAAPATVPDEVTELGSLPANARRYVEFVERELEVTVSLVGTGAERERVLSPGSLEALARP